MEVTGLQTLFLTCGSGSERNVIRPSVFPEILLFPFLMFIFTLLVELLPR